jgi:DNA polymerase-3 subunit gamma/tau
MPEGEPGEVSVDALRSILISALEAQGQDTAADVLARSEWRIEGNHLALRLPVSEKLLDITLNSESRRLLTHEASRRCGRAIKLMVCAGGIVQNAPIERTSMANGNGAGARQRAAEDPIVRRMQEKFGAEVRTVVDLRHKK